MTKMTKMTINMRNKPVFVSMFVLAALVILSPMFSLPAYPGGSDGFSSARFAGANQLYRDGKFKEALDVYLQLADKGAHWKLYYNMGNCYYKLNQPVRAKIFYLRAQRLAPFEDSIGKNVGIVNKHPLLNDKTPAEKPDFISRLMLRIESILSLNVLTILLILVILAFNVFLFLLIKGGKRRWLVYSISFSLFALIVLGSYHIYRVNKQNRRDIAVIVSPNSQLRSGPGENNTVLFKVNPGLKVRIIETSGDWIQVTASSDIAGWLPVKNAEPI